MSAAANIVEGSARVTAADYARFLSIAYASACEAQYEIDLAHRLGYLKPETAESLKHKAASASRLLHRLAAAVKSFGR